MGNPKVCDIILFTFAIILLIVAAMMAACISLILPRKSVQRTRTLNEINDTDFDPTFNESAWLNSLKWDRGYSLDYTEIIVSISIFDGQPNNTRLMCTGTAINKKTVLTVQTCQLLNGRNISWSKMTVRSQSKYFSQGGITHEITETHPCTKEGLQDIIALIVHPSFSDYVINPEYKQTVFGGIITENGAFRLSGFGGDIVATDDIQWNDTKFVNKPIFNEMTPLCSEYITNGRWTHTINDTELYINCFIKVQVPHDKSVSAKNGYVGGNGRPYYQVIINEKRYLYTILGIQVNPLMSAASPDRHIIHLDESFEGWIKKELNIERPSGVRQILFDNGAKLTHFYQEVRLSIFLRNWYRYYENEFYGMPLENIWYVYENYTFFTNDPLDMPFPPHATEDQTIAQFKRKSMKDVAIETDDYELNYDDHSGLSNNDEDIYISPGNKDTLEGSGVESGSGFL